MQALSLQAFRGRVMSIYSVLALGTTVMGGPLVGWVSHGGARGSRSGSPGSRRRCVASTLALGHVSSRELVGVEAPDVDIAVL